MFAPAVLGRASARAVGTARLLLLLTQCLQSVGGPKKHSCGRWQEDAANSCRHHPRQTALRRAR
eukprot:scaffold113410_cov20-Tisochrysis_lutea.AAC.3